MCAPNAYQALAAFYCKMGARIAGDLSSPSASRECAGVQYANPGDSGCGPEFTPFATVTERPSDRGTTLDGCAPVAMGGER